MTHDYLANWNFGWSWLLGFGFWFLLLSSFGHGRYAYRFNQRYTAQPGKNALDLLNERYARGDIDRDEYRQLKQEMATK